MNNIFHLVYRIGFFMGRLAKYRISSVWDIYVEGLHNGRISSRLKEFGHHSKVSRKAIIVNPQCISLGDNCIIAESCLLETIRVSNLSTKRKAEKDPEMVIGNNCTIGSYSHISCSNRITIEDGLLTGKFCLIIDNSHGYNDGSDYQIAPECRDIISKGPVHIKKNVWLADKVAVLPGVTIGEGSIIASNSVVTHNIPPYSIAAGVPARVIKQIHSSK